jgi:tellurite resistance protein TehA-like permease
LQRRVIPKMGTATTGELMDSGTQLLGSLTMIGIILALVLVVCWIILPFAILGTKPLLRDLLREQKRSNDLLSQRLNRQPNP